MPKKLSLSELILYYVKKYDLADTCKTSETSKKNIGTYRQAVTRLLQSKKIGNITLYDAIKTENKPRKISIEEFENLCLFEWLTKIKNYVGKEKRKQFDEDMALATQIERHNQSLSEPDQEEFFEDTMTTVAADIFQNTKNAMMLQAIYEIFYEPFNDEKLLNDLNTISSYDGSFNPPVSVIKSNNNLQDYKTYIGKRKSS